MDDVVNPGEGFALQIVVPHQRRTILTPVRLCAMTCRATSRIDLFRLCPSLRWRGVLTTERQGKKDGSDQSDNGPQFRYM